MRSFLATRLAAGLFLAVALAVVAAAPGSDRSVRKDPEEQARVGTPCEVHPRHRLRLGLAPIHYGIVGCSPGANDDPKRFPNARMCASGGCVIQPERWAEVAYCRECRAAYRQTRAANRRTIPDELRHHGWR
jgi:hypothetical protein